MEESPEKPGPVEGEREDGDGEGSYSEDMGRGEPVTVGGRPATVAPAPPSPALLNPALARPALLSPAGPKPACPYTKGSMWGYILNGREATEDLSADSPFRNDSTVLKDSRSILSRISWSAKARGGGGGVERGGRG